MMYIKRIKNAVFFSLFLMIIVIFINMESGQAELDLQINEICSRNETVIYDSKGYFYDYIELYNPTEEPINLVDYFLSDTSWNLRKYQLPDVCVESKSYQIIFINEKEAGFAVGNDEVIYLSNAVGGGVDMIPVPDVKCDLVYARNEKSGEWFNNQMPTPNTANENGETIEGLIVDKEVEIIFSVESGFYDEPFYLEMYSNKGEEIYYTLDGSEPTKNSLRYTEPILIEDATENENVYSMRTDVSVEEVIAPDYPVDKCNVIRAISVANDGRVSEEKVASYFVGYAGRYGYENICVVSLVSNPENLFSSDRGIYVTGDIAEWNRELNATLEPNQAYANYTREGVGWRRSAYVEIFNEDGMSELVQNIDISIHGGYSTLYPQKGFNLLTPSEIERGEYIFKFSNGKQYSSLMLRPGGINDWSKTQFRDVLNGKLVEERNLTTLSGIPCQVFLNGEYWGLYNLQERIDNGLIAKEFGQDIDNLIVTKQNYVVEGNDEQYRQFETIVDFAEKYDLSKDVFYNQIASMIDIQSFIDYNCFEIYVANCDSITNNVSCWRTKEMTNSQYGDGKWRWIIYDTDDSTGIIDGMTNPEVDSFSAGHWNTTPMEEPLLSALLENESFKEQFVQTFVDMAYSDFEPERVNKLIDSYCDKYMEAAVISRHRYGDMEYTEEAYLCDVQVVRNFFEKRSGYIVEYLYQNMGVY